MTGIVGDKWDLERFAPMESIPSSVRLTTYAGGAGDFMRTPLQEIVKDVEAGEIDVRIGREFQLEQIVEAHQIMEENRAQGKLVISTD